MAGRQSSSRADESALEKLARIVDERVNAAFETRDKRQREDSDPWAKLEGIIDRAVESALDRRLGDLMDEEEDEEPQRGGRRTGKQRDDDAGPLSLFGGA